MAEFFIPGPEGRLDAIYTQADDPMAPIVIVQSPDPRLGGTMNNAVTATIHGAFQASGFAVLRFNYRRVHGDVEEPVVEVSDEYPDEMGSTEISDATVAINHLQQLRPATSGTWVAGYSYGAWIALQLVMRRPEIAGFVAVSAPITQYDFSFLAPCPVSGLFVTARLDRTVPKRRNRDFLSSLREQSGPEILHREIQNANHHYEEGLDTLDDAIRKYLKKRMRDYEFLP